MFPIVIIMLVINWSKNIIEDLYKQNILKAENTVAN